MLEGIRVNPIVLGAYTDSRGGICPVAVPRSAGAWPRSSRGA
jgi:hypothetical protein